VPGQGPGAGFHELQKENPAGASLAGKSGRAGREMALPAKFLGQQVLASRWYWPVKAKATLFFYLINN
jgi:hypothetical protein